MSVCVGASESVCMCGCECICAIFLFFGCEIYVDISVSVIHLCTYLVYTRLYYEGRLGYTDRLIISCTHLLGIRPQWERPFQTCSHHSNTWMSQ